ncbi:hypothetical protein [Metabacillus sp. Hm71]|uniref:hypothetical protein n=1 Tax=Metabacillus sp. Hm71 TaxID=3450743 RepID=UPI003F44209A
MILFKLKSLYVKQKKRESLQVNEKPAEGDIVLKIADFKKGKQKDYYFLVPTQAIVEIHYETIDQKNLLRFVFYLEQRNLSIQYFTWNEVEQHYIEAPLKNEIIQSHSFQVILQSISYSGDQHISFIVNSIQRLTDLPN